MFEQLLGRIAEAFAAAALPYMVIGGQAVLLYGEPRLTQDIDVTVGVAPDRLPDVLRAVEHAGLRPLVDDSFVEETLVLPCEDAASHIRVDVIFSFSDYEREAMQRTRRVALAGTEVRFASLEDLLIHKLVAGRPRDTEDAQNVLLKHADVDTAYVRRWLAAFEEALDRPLRDAFDALYRETRRT